jgi:hypothetical protein
MALSREADALACQPVDGDNGVLIAASSTNLGLITR